MHSNHAAAVDHGIDHGKIISESLKTDAFGIRGLPMILITVSAAMCIYIVSMEMIFKLLPLISSHADIPAKLFWDIVVFIMQILCILLLFWILSLFAGGIITKKAGEDVRVARSVARCVSEGASSLSSYSASSESSVSVSERASESGIKECAAFVKRKMMSMIFAGILITFIPAVLSVGLAEIPYVGQIFNLIVGILIDLMTFVTYPVIIISDKGAINGISSSIKHFFSHKLDVFIVWLLASVISIIISGLFSIPLIAYIIFFLFSIHAHPHDDISYQIYDVLVRTFPFLVASTLVIAVGIGIITAFSFGVRARYYASYVYASSTQ